VTIIFDGRVFEIPFSGIAKSTWYLYKACLKLKPDLKFIGFYQDKLFRELSGGERGGIAFEKINVAANEINNLCAKHNAAVIHFPWNGSIPKGVAGKKAVTLHDALPLEIPFYFGRGPVSALRKLRYMKKTQNDIKQSDMIFTVSEYSKKQIEKSFFVPEGAIVLPHGAAIEAPDENFSAPLPDTPYFLYSGGFDRRKGIKQLLRAFCAVYQNGVDAQLLLAGEPSHIDDETEDFLRQGMEDRRIQQLGFVSDNELAYYYQHALATVYLSIYEGFGLPPLEALYCGAKIVLANAASLPEVYGNCAYYIDPYDAECDLETLLRDEVAPADEVLRKYVFDKSASLMLDLMREVETE